MNHNPFSDKFYRPMTMREAERRVLSVWKRRTEITFRPTLPGLSVMKLAFCRYFDRALIRSFRFLRAWFMQSEGAKFSQGVNPFDKPSKSDIEKFVMSFVAPALSGSP
jgi:hypothetical protein